MKKSLLFLLVPIGLIVLIVGLIIFKNKKPESNGIILFYREDCLHCQNVEKYIEDNKIGEKVKFEKKEIYYDTNNAEILVEKAKICGLSTEEIGVPFLWDGKNCIVGDQDIINFFGSQIKGK